MAYETMRRLELSGCECKPQIEIRFPELIDDAFIQNCAEADVLGVTDWFHTHRPGADLIMKAKEINPNLLAIVGGVNAKNLWRQILLNNPGVDLVCNGEGEDVLWRILAGEAFSGIPNLCCRDDGMPVRTASLEIDLSKIGLWDFNLCNHEELERWLQEIGGNQMSHAPAGLSITRGCLKRDQCGPCVFCTCPGKYRKSPAEFAVRQVRHLQSQGIGTYFETGDDFTDVELLREIERAADGELAKLWIYANPARVTPECAQLMRRVGVFDAFMGFETAVESVSRKSNRPADLSQVELAARNLADVGIIPSTGVMLGLPGETIDTAEATSEALIGLVDRNPAIERVLVSIAVPFAGSAWYWELANDPFVSANYRGETGRDLASDDDPDYLCLLKHSLQQSGMELEAILALADELRSEVQNRVCVGSFGALEGAYQKSR